MSWFLWNEWELSGRGRDGGRYHRQREEQEQM